MFDRQKGHLLYSGGTSAQEVVMHLTMFYPLVGHPKGHTTTFVQWKVTLAGTLPHFVHWKGTLEGASSCFIYHRGIQEDTLWHFS